MITDEIVAKAEDAYDKNCSDMHGCETTAIRAALKAVAPMLIAQGLREIAATYFPGVDVAQIFLRRAQELDPQ